MGEGEEEEERPKVVIIHDAVRPFVDEDFLYQIAVAAKEHGVSVIQDILTKTPEYSSTSRVILYII